MSANAMYAIGTLLVWIGAGAAFLFFARLLDVLLNKPFRNPLTSENPLSPMNGGERGQGVRGSGETAAKLFIPAAVGGAGLFFGALITRSGEGWQVPLVWLVMPLPAWLLVVCAAVGTFRLIQSFMALTREETIQRGLAGVVWLLIGGIFLSVFLKGSGTVEILRGSVPIQPTTLLALALLAFAAMLAMVLAARQVKSRGHAYGFVTHAALMAGSVLFGLPFAFLLVTSFKEDRDMVSVNGVIWVPKVQLEVPHFDKKNPMYETELDGVSVSGEIIERLPDGQVKLDVIRPIAIRGKTFLTTMDKLKVVPKMAPLVKSTYRGQNIEGKVVDNRANGEQVISIMKPESLKGREFAATPSQVEPVREVGLKWKNYSEALEYLPPESQKGLIYLKNTLLLVIFNVVGTILSSAIVAYAFSRMRFPGKNLLFLLMLSTMMLPGAVTMLPQFLIFRNLGWVDTLYPLWIKSLFASAFNVFLLRQFFMTIPMELEDAAKIDGSSYLTTFWRIMLPLVKPALAVIGVMTFVGAWNDFMGPLIYINSPENMPISYAVQLYSGDRATEPGLVMAFVTMAMLPVLAVFFFAQRYFIEGVTLSGLGGR